LKRAFLKFLTPGVGFSNPIPPGTRLNLPYPLRSELGEEGLIREGAAPLSLNPHGPKPSRSRADRHTWLGDPGFMKSKILIPFKTYV